MFPLVIPAHLTVFIISALVLLLTPGPAVMYIIARSIDQGRRVGLASVFGVELGNSVHVLAATFGLSAILHTSALLFNVVKYAGAAYLIYLGVRTLLRPAEAKAEAESAPKNIGKTFLQGTVVATLNPKTALFFLAFLPQFVDVNQGQVSQQFLLLGMIFVGMAVITDGMYALLSGTLGGWLRNNVWFLRFQRYVAGTIYIGLGLSAAVGGSSKS